MYPDLATVPSLGYALAFLLDPDLRGAVLIPTCSLDHSTVQYEPVMQNEAEEILSALRNSIASNFAQYHGSSRVVRNGLLLDSNT